jgi:hypothetical protein
MTFITPESDESREKLHDRETAENFLLFFHWHCWSSWAHSQRLLRGLRNLAVLVR